MSEIPIPVPVILVFSVNQGHNDYYNSNWTRDTFTFQLAE